MSIKENINSSSTDRLSSGIKGFASKLQWRGRTQVNCQKSLFVIEKKIQLFFFNCNWLTENVFEISSHLIKYFFFVGNMHIYYLSWSHYLEREFPTGLASFYKLIFTIRHG